MLWPVFIMLLLLWLVGVVASFTLNGFIHLLLALAAIVLVAQVTTRTGKDRGAAPKVELPSHESARQERRDGAA